MVSNKKTTVVIVGVGAVGVAMIDRLVNDICATHTAPIRILAFEKSGHFGTGVAFQTDLKHVILNRTGLNMSASSLNPAHFADWLNQLGYPDDSQSSYLPRQTFGHYLQSTLRSAIEKASAHGHEVTLISKSIQSIEKRAHDYEVFDGGNRWPAQHILLCTGNLPQTNYMELSGLPNYFPTPFPPYKLRDSIAPDSAVGIIGSRLSAVDALISLAKAGHRGPITLLSRKGYLPSVQRVPANWTLTYCTGRRIAALRIAGGGNLSYRMVLRLVLKELSAACGRRFSIATQKPQHGDHVALFRRDIAHAMLGPQMWQAAFVALNAVIGDLWNCLSEVDQQRFKKRDFSRFMALRVPIPMENAREVARLLDDGQLTLLPGLQTLRAHQQVFEATADGAIKQRFDVIVNCTGADNDLIRTKDPLFSSLLASGLLCAHPLGGVRVNFSSNQANDGGNQTQGEFYVVGNLTSGTHLFCSVLEVNTHHCARVSAQILATIGMNAQEGLLHGLSRHGAPPALASNNA
jgi:uncharacterized NAD(P)/FAD-binding protein YdhS